MTREGLIDQEGTSRGRVLAALARAASLRIARKTQVLIVKGETFTLARPLIEEVAVTLGVPEMLVLEAIAEGEASQVLRVQRDDDGVIVALRADPL